MKWIKINESLEDGFKTNKEVTKKVDELIQAVWKDAKNEDKLEAFQIFEEKLSRCFSGQTNRNDP